MKRLAGKITLAAVLAAALCFGVAGMVACGDSGDDSGTTGGNDDGKTTSSTYTLVFDDGDDYMDALDEGELPMCHLDAHSYDGNRWKYAGITEIDFELTIDDDGSYTLVETVVAHKDDPSNEYYLFDEYVVTGGTWTSTTDGVYTLSAATSITRTLEYGSNPYYNSDGLGTSGTYTGDAAAADCPGCTATVSGTTVAFSNGVTEFADYYGKTA